MKRRIDICEKCAKFERIENGGIGCSLCQSNDLVIKIEEPELGDNKYFKPIGNITLEIVPKTDFFKEKEFEAFEVGNDCVLYAEYCMEEWNE